MRGSEGKDKLRSVLCFRLEQLMGGGRITGVGNMGEKALWG